jgi:hypothetical protein
LDRGFQPQIAIYDFPGTANQNGDLESELFNGRHHPLHSMIVLSQMAVIGN